MSEMTAPLELLSGLTASGLLALLCALMFVAYRRDVLKREKNGTILSERAFDVIERNTQASEALNATISHFGDMLREDRRERAQLMTELITRSRTQG